MHVAFFQKNTNHNYFMMFCKHRYPDIQRMFAAKASRAAAPPRNLDRGKFSRRANLLPDATIWAWSRLPTPDPNLYLGLDLNSNGSGFTVRVVQIR